MASINKSVIAEMATELTFQTSTLNGSWQLLGTLSEQPVQIIFDNQSTDRAVEIGNNNSTVWKTFEAGEALVLDMRGNHGIADNYAFRKSMPIYIRGTAGGAAGTYMRISYTYANPLTE